MLAENTNHLILQNERTAKKLGIMIPELRQAQRELSQTTQVRCYPSCAYKNRNKYVMRTDRDMRDYIERLETKV